MLVTIVCLLNANICNQIRTNRTVALAATETSAVVSAHKKGLPGSNPQCYTVFDGERWQARPPCHVLAD